METLSREQIYEQVRTSMARLFELDPADIQPTAHLGDDLDLDSIDAIDLVVELQKFAGRKIQPDEFKQIRTVDDIVNAVEHLIKHQ